MSTDVAHVPAYGEPIPASPNFPIQWRNQEDEQYFWTLDRLHLPHPISPTTDDVFHLMYDGFNRAAAGYDMPIRAHVNRLNSYHYMSIAPLPLQPAELEELGNSAQDKLGAVMGELESRWRNDWLPQIKAHLAFFEGLDLEGTSLSQLRQYLREAITHYEDMWRLHFETIFPAYLPLSIFEDMYCDLFDTDNNFDAHRLLQGFDNMTVKTGRALWMLSRRALALPKVRKILNEEESASVIPSLEKISEGRAFLAELDAFLAEYGQRGDLWDVQDTSWIEDPTPVIKNLKDYVGQPDRDWDKERAQMAAERENAISEARKQLAGYPQEAVDQFEFFLKAAQMGSILSEDHGFWIDFRGAYQLRRLLLALGDRLAQAGTIETRDDIFYLTLEEMANIDETDRQWKAQVAARKQEMEHYRSVTPPPAAGTMPPGPPPEDPMSHAISKFFGVPIDQSTDSSEIRGHAGSAGTVRGVARVIRSLADGERLQRGEILVTETTAPPWTPLFATAAAVVTDTGGILSHCAVVAREYGIPAVVGTGVATTLIEDGQMIEVDGSSGLVRIVERAAV